MLNLIDKKKDQGRLGMVFRSLAEAWIQSNNLSNASSSNSGNSSNSSNQMNSKSNTTAAAAAAADSTKIRHNKDQGQNAVTNKQKAKSEGEEKGGRGGAGGGADDSAGAGSGVAAVNPSAPTEGIDPTTAVVVTAEVGGKQAEGSVGFIGRGGDGPVADDDDDMGAVVSINGPSTLTTSSLYSSSSSVASSSSSSSRLTGTRASAAAAAAKEGEGGETSTSPSSLLKSSVLPVAPESEGAVSKSQVVKWLGGVGENKEDKGGQSSLRNMTKVTAGAGASAAASAEDTGTGATTSATNNSNNTSVIDQQQQQQQQRHQHQDIMNTVEAKRVKAERAEQENQITERNNSSSNKKKKKKKKLEFYWFDFHKECAKMKWHNLSKIFVEKGATLDSLGWFAQVMEFDFEEDHCPTLFTPLFTFDTLKKNDILRRLSYSFFPFSSTSGCVMLAHMFLTIHLSPIHHPLSSPLGS